MMELRDKRVTVMGLGVNSGGVGVVRFLSQQGVREIIVTDLQSTEVLAASREALRDIPSVRYVLGEHRLEDFTSVDLVIKNPAIPWTNTYIRAAEEANVPVEMDSSLFFQYCPAPIIGVTGTKGKTTTATLLAFLLRAAGQRVVEIGTGQRSVLGLLDQVDAGSVVVFELSSWRLSGLRHCRQSPHIAIFTNFFPDHLNYYPSMDEYFNDKRMICAFQQRGDILVRPVEGERFDEPCGEGRVILFGSEDTHQKSLVFWLGESIVYRDEIGVERVIFDGAQTVLLRGEHNQSNILAAVGGALAQGLTSAQIQQALPTFSGVEHRLEHVRTWRGIQWYNDTTATVPEASILAMESFTEPIVLLAGGADKNLDFTAWAQTFVMHPPRASVFFRGQATDKCLEALRAVGVDTDVFPVVESMDEAIAYAQTVAREGDVVLLSPGAASFGIFQNEFDRGEKFRRLVLALEEK